jgi:hypothetical protein
MTDNRLGLPDVAEGEKTFGLTTADVELVAIDTQNRVREPERGIPAPVS